MYRPFGGGFTERINMRNQDKIQIGILIFKDQLAKIDEAAKAMGLSRSAYIRHVILKNLEE